MKVGPDPNAPRINPLFLIDVMREIVAAYPPKMREEAGDLIEMIMLEGHVITPEDRAEYVRHILKTSQGASSKFGP